MAYLYGILMLLWRRCFSFFLVSSFNVGNVFLLHLNCIFITSVCTAFLCAWGTIKASPAAFWRALWRPSSSYWSIHNCKPHTFDQFNCSVVCICICICICLCICIFFLYIPRHCIVLFCHECINNVSTYITTERLSNKEAFQCV